MRMDAQFDAAARAALHCDALVARAAQPADGLTGLARLGGAFAPRLAARLGPLFAAGEWEVACAPAEWIAGEALLERIGPQAGNMLLPVGDAGGRLFASVALLPLATRLARLFGGGAEEMVLRPGRKLPGSVSLLLARLGVAISQALGEGLDPAFLRAGEPPRVEPDTGRLACFPPGTQAALLPLRLSSGEDAPLDLLLACRKSLLGRLLAHVQSEGAPAADATPECLSGALADIPLPLTARIAELSLPAQRLLGLAPGQVLPLALPRSVPLLVQGRKVATGAIGEQDDRVAIAIEKTFVGEMM